ncbi:Hypothetical predicted protein [Mytilus galloprovincialis]|uniref:C1q domain-containing protein n=1 Tax=Mytilus galloprovincialis TaxID=29158 RepID=A0A8B6D0X6_MYTGA|nr:Hypothetical predicted protein [Mytilus galloprovincialis]
MGFPLLFLVISLVLACDAFLLDDRTKPATTSGPLLSDQHYNFLINLIMNERQTRVKLEQHVVRLEQELLATQQGVTDIYHTSSINNATLEQEAKNWRTIRIENNDLKKKYNLLEYKFNALARNHSNLENYTKVLEKGVASLQQLKGVTDLQTLLNVRNETNILREELKMTNNSLNYVRNEAEARKQDFVALLNKADSIEHKLELSIRALNNSMNHISETLHYKQNQTALEVIQMQYEIQTYKFNQSVTFKHFQENLTSVEKIQNLSVGKLDLEVHNMSNRAAFTVCASAKTYSGGSTITFPSAHAKYGVSNSTLSGFGSSGKFKCEKAGLYLISGFFMTGTKGLAYLDFYKKDERIGLIYFSVTAGNSFQTSSISTVQFLDKHDTYYIKAGTNINLGGDNYSCITFLQLTNG